MWRVQRALDTQHATRNNAGSSKGAILSHHNLLNKARA